MIFAFICTTFSWWFQVCSRLELARLLVRFRLVVDFDDDPLNRDCLAGSYDFRPETMEL